MFNEVTSNAPRVEALTAALGAQTPPEGAATGAAMIAQMSDEEFGRDRSDENPMVGKPAPAPDELEVVARLQEMLDRTRDCTVCDGDGIKESGKDCRVCDATGKVLVYSGKDRTAIAGAHSAFTDATRLLNQERDEKARLAEECQQSMGTIARERRRAEAAEARVAKLKKARTLWSRSMAEAEQRGRKAGLEEAAKMAEDYADFSMSAHLTKQTKFAIDVAARSIASEIRAKADEVKP